MPMLVTGSTTLSDLDNWLERKPNVVLIRLKRPNEASNTTNLGYRAVAELVGNEPAIIGESSESLVEAISAMVDCVEVLFPD